MTSIWQKLKVGLLVAMLYAVYLLIQSVRTIKAALSNGISRESEG